MTKFLGMVMRGEDRVLGVNHPSTPNFWGLPTYAIQFDLE